MLSRRGEHIIMLAGQDKGMGLGETVKGERTVWKGCAGMRGQGEQAW